MSVATTTRQVAQRGRLRRRLLHFLVVAGPGLIVMVADNDAGAVSTYTQAGAEYGNALLWLLPLLLPMTYFVQEMVARLGIATGEGLAALIYHRFGAWWGRFSLADLLVVNFLTLVTEFAAVAMAAKQLHLPPGVVVPLSAIGLILLVGTGSYRRWERLTLGLCGLNLAWFALAALVHPDWGNALADTVRPHLPAGGLTGNLMFMVIAVVGTTIAPWQLFFQQSCVADKKLRFADLKAARIDTIVGAVAVIAIAGCMMLLGGALFRHGAVPYQDPAQMARRWCPAIGHARQHADPAADVQRRAAGGDGGVAVLRLGLGRGDGLAQHAAGEDQRGAAVLRSVRAVRRRRGRRGADPAGAVAGHRAGRAGAVRRRAAAACWCSCTCWSTTAKCWASASPTVPGTTG